MTHLGTFKTGFAGFVVSGLALLLAACGGSPNSGVASLGKSKTTTTAQPSVVAGPGAGKQTGYAEMLQYSQCIRSHGVPGFPDPSNSPNGGQGFKITPSEHIAQGSPQFQAAQQACKKLLPNGGETTPAEHAKTLAQALKYVQCMRSHGVAKFPDPSTQGGGVNILIDPNSGINPSSSQFQAAASACQKLMP